MAWFIIGGILSLIGAIISLIGMFMALSEPKHNHNMEDKND